MGNNASTVAKYQKEAALGADLDTVEMNLEDTLCVWDMEAYLDAENPYYGFTDETEGNFAVQDDDDVGEGQNATASESNDVNLFDDSSLTITASCLLTKKFAQRRNLTHAAVTDLLQLNRMHCPRPNCCPPSVYLLR